MFLARRELLRFFPSIRFSGIMETQPLQISNPEPFNNQIAVFNTENTLHEVIGVLKSIEKASGRTPGESRLIPLDIDLLCYDGVILKPEDWKREYIASGINELNIKDQV